MTQSTSSFGENTRRTPCSGGYDGGSKAQPDSQLEETDVQALQMSESPPAGELIPRSAAEIELWLATKIAARLQVPSSEVNLDEPLIDIGLDSMEFVALVGELEHWLDCRFRDNPLIDYPTISTLSEFLAGELAAGRRNIVPARPAEAGVGV